MLSPEYAYGAGVKSRVRKHKQKNRPERGGLVLQGGVEMNETFEGPLIDHAPSIFETIRDNLRNP